MNMVVEYKVLAYEDACFLKFNLSLNMWSSFSPDYANLCILMKFFELQNNLKEKRCIFCEYIFCV